MARALLRDRFLTQSTPGKLSTKRSAQGVPFAQSPPNKVPTNHTTHAKKTAGFCVSKKHFMGTERTEGQGKPCTGKPGQRSQIFKVI